MSRNKKHLDFELNLIPFIDLLSTCICFLLLTAVWMNIGAMDVKQAVGGQASEKSDKKPMVWVNVGDRGDLMIEVQNSSKIAAKMAKSKVPSKDGRPDFESASSVLQQIRNAEPGLATALIQPTKAVLYEDIIALMDSCKRIGMNDLGVVPL